MSPKDRVIAAILSIPMIVMIIASIILFSIYPNNDYGLVLIFINVFYIMIACVTSAINLGSKYSSRY